MTELSDAAAIVAPASETQASLFRNLDATMAALREVARPYIQDSITERQARAGRRHREPAAPAAVPAPTPRA